MERYGTPNTMLTRLSLAIRNSMTGTFGGYQAEMVSPSLPSPIKGTYISWHSGDFQQNPVNLKGDADIGREIKISGTTGTYECLPYGSHATYTERELALFAQGLSSTSPLASQLRRAKTLAVTEADMISHEVRVMTLVGTAGSYASANKATLTNTWADKVNGTPIANVETAKLAVHASASRMPTDMLIGMQTWSNLKQHPEIVAQVNASNRSAGPGEISVDQVSNIFGLRIHVSGARYTTDGTEALDGATTGYVWSDKALIYHKSPAPSVFDYSLSYTFSYKDFQFRLYRDPETGVWKPINEHDVVSKLTAAGAGYLISNTDA